LRLTPSTVFVPVSSDFTLFSHFLFHCQQTTKDSSIKRSIDQ
jgi:hypothetical protein